MWYIIANFNIINISFYFYWILINYFYNPNSGDRRPHNLLQLRPVDRSILNRGDSFEVECVATDEPGLDIYWVGPDGTQILPSNIRQVNNRLIIDNVQVQNQGKYICKCETDGHIYEQEYELNVENEDNIELLKPKVEYADVGSNVVLKCQSDRGQSARYQWSRPNGKLPEGQDYNYVSIF